tara:strand:- start:486 stop:1373 length:888 start_codon:yes stop_codon:yes gene_type:complete
MQTKIIYFDNSFIKDNDGILILDKKDSYTENFGKQWRDYRDIQIDSLNNFDVSRNYLNDMFFNKPERIENKKILEIGSGAGRFTEHLIKKAKICVSVDLSSSIFYNVSKNKENLILIKADFNKLIIKEKFDIVFCRGVLQHTPNPFESILNIHSFVKDGGEVFFDIYKMPKIGYLHPKYFLWRPLIKKFIKYETFEKFLHKNIILLLFLKKIIKIITFKSNFISDSIIPLWDYTGMINIDKNKLKLWSIMDTLDGIYAKYDFPQRTNKIISFLKKNNFKIVNINRKKNIFNTKTN